MTQDYSALLAQLDSLKSADAGAVLAELIRVGLQALIEVEATEAIDAGHYQNCADRGTHRHAPAQDGVHHSRRHRSADPKLRAFPRCWSGGAASTSSETVLRTHHDHTLT